MAHPSRIENVNKTCSILNLTQNKVVFDDRTDGGDAMYTALKTWSLPLEKQYTHRLVLQDDIELCNNFRLIVEKIAASNPDNIISLFHELNYFRKEKYIPLRRLYGCGILMPVKYIENFINYVNENRYKDDKSIENFKHDTFAIYSFALINKIKMLDTNPSLLQHIGDNSLIDPTWEIRKYNYFIKDIGIDGW